MNKPPTLRKARGLIRAAAPEEGEWKSKSAVSVKYKKECLFQYNCMHTVVLVWCGSPADQQLMHLTSCLPLFTEHT